ncbi:hypothetical protein [Micromonospora parathelypteridis]|uniref:Uncharacterized protein n=1 Tax=Micromonospora parathelypteridis TaxID=1839617 RepID=A0A840W704_9ACTN|nr:hypothetical protein [Micromonospora parathelypteridis]MBB5478871.1 hypothetical protein [Micromonospora parathelypteridis]GGO04181.1 hypothetical protein GCM10011576_05330 [Micromonospora parathelypteridis]
MTSNDDARPALFLATSNANGLDGSAVTFDGSEEAMRRLRHPFAVTPAPQAPIARDDADRRG